MDRVVVDTDVVSFYFRNDSRFTAYASELDGRQLVASFMTVAELRLWQELRNWSAKRRQLLFRELDSRYLIYPVNRELCFLWAAMKSQSRASGRVLQTADAWIAATARLLDVPLVTHNRKDFDYLTGLEVISFPSN